MFQEAIDAVNTKYASPRARAAFARFKNDYFSGTETLEDLVILPLRKYPIVSRRYERALYQIMRDPERALSATPVTKENAVLSHEEISQARLAAHYLAWRSTKDKVSLIIISALASLALVENTIPSIKKVLDNKLDNLDEKLLAPTLIMVVLLIAQLPYFYVRWKKKQLGIPNIKELIHEKPEV